MKQMVPAQYVTTQNRAVFAVRDRRWLRQNRRPWPWPPTFEGILEARKTTDWLLDQSIGLTATGVTVERTIEPDLAETYSSEVMYIRHLAMSMPALSRSLLRERCRRNLRQADPPRGN